MDKQNVIYIYIKQNIIQSFLKRQEILTHAATWMNPEDIMLSEINQSQRQILCDVISLV